MKSLMNEWTEIYTQNKAFKHQSNILYCVLQYNVQSLASQQQTKYHDLNKFFVCCVFIYFNKAKVKKLNLIHLVFYLSAIKYTI